MSVQKKMIIGLIGLAVSCGLAAGEGMRLSERKQDGRTEWVVSHTSYRVSVSPDAGGALRFEDSVAGVPTGSDGAVLGQAFLRECFSEEQMQGDMPVIAFQHEVKENTPERIAIAVAATLSEKVAGVDLAGVRLTRTMVFTAGKPYIEVEIRLENPTEAMRYVTLGVRNRFRLDPRGNDMFHLPTTRNVLEINKNGHVWDYYAAERWEYEPVEGWMGVTDPAKAVGIVFVMDHNMLEALYADGQTSTTGWMLDGGALSPGGTFVTRYLCVPVKGFKKFVHASEKLIADIAVTLQQGRIAVTHSLVSLTPLKDVMIETTVFDVRPQSQRAAVTAKLPQVDFALRTVSSVVEGGSAGPVVVRTAVSACDLREKYEFMAECGFRSKSIPYLPLAVEYRRPMPTQVKPDQGKAAATGLASVERGKKALLFYGVYTQCYQFDKILDGWAVKTANSPPKRVKYLPPASTIHDYSLIVLSDVPATALPASTSRRIAGYVEAGGNLLVMGGPYAYGQGGFQNSSLDPLLPVYSSSFDLKQRQGGVPVHVNKRHPATDGIDLGNDPRVFWLHQCPLKEDKNVEVLLTAGEYDTLLVSRPYGKGRVLSFLGAPLGEPTQGQTPFWEWEGWVPLMRNTVEWLYAQQNRREIK